MMRPNDSRGRESTTLGFVSTCNRALQQLQCYPTPGKAKASLLCALFAQGAIKAGADARAVSPIPAHLAAGVAAFYGVVPETAHLWRQAQAEGRDWYYIDNSYFDRGRGTHYRITRNRVQHAGDGASDGARLKALGVEIRPPRVGGGHVVVCLQSPQFMRTIAGIEPDAWWRQIQPVLQASGLPVRLRGWNGDKRRQMATLRADLVGAALLVTWSSAAAIEALLAGVPVHCAPECAAHGVTTDDRHRWAAVLADNQWTTDEIADGTAWKALDA